MGKRRAYAQIFLLLGCVTVLTGCATMVAHEDHLDHSPQAVVSAYLAALNRRDLLALTAYVAPNVEWYSVVNGERVLEIANREALDQMLRRYFEQHERTQWFASRVAAINQVVAVVERSQWSESGRMESRTGLAVYEVDAGRIRRMTYFLQSN